MTDWNSNLPVGESVGSYAGEDHSAAEIYIFAKNLKKHLKGDLELAYITLPESMSINHGTLRLQTSNGREFLLRVAYVTKRTFEGIGEELEWTRISDTVFRSPQQA